METDLTHIKRITGYRGKKYSLGLYGIDLANLIRKLNRVSCTVAEREQKMNKIVGKRDWFTIFCPL